jgi:hypothetical protein
MKALSWAKEDIEDVLLQKGDNENLMLMNATKNTIVMKQKWRHNYKVWEKVLNEGKHTC